MRKKKRWTLTDTKKVIKHKKSMEAPMCRLCETRHWSNAPHHFEPKAKPKRRRREDGIYHDDIKARP